MTGGTSHSWDYQNRLTQSVVGGATTTYTYDHSGQRVSKSTASTTTKYPFSNYEITGTTTTKHIYAGNTLIATVKGTGTSSITYHNHLDHLDSTSAVTDNDGYLNQSISYRPFGDTRVDMTYGTLEQDIQYTGHTYDEETELLYMGARYYPGSTGRFISQDPVYQSVGDSRLIKEKTSLELVEYLKDPQALNSYSYVRNNPIRVVDKNGEWFQDVVTGKQSFGDFQIEVGQATQYMSDNSTSWDYAVSNPVKAGLAVGVTGAAASVPAVASVAGIATMEAGVGAAYVGKMAVGSALYGYVTKNTLDSLPVMVTGYSKFNTQDMSTWKSPVMNTGLMYGPNALGEHIGALYDIVDSLRNLVKDLGIEKRKVEKKKDN